MVSQVIAFLLWALLAIIIIIGVWFVLNQILNEAFGQTATTTVPATPAPNPQYLPQKAYIQVFPPDGVAVTPVQESSSQFNINELLYGLVGGGVSAAYAKFKSSQNEKANKETMAAEVKTKEQVGELARVTFDNMPQKGNEVTDAPAIKLETLKEDKQETADKAAKA